MAQSDFSFSGFGSVGVAHDNADKVGFTRTISQPNSEYNDTSFYTDTLFGIQGNYNINAEWQVVAQMVGRHQRNGNFNKALEWAYVHWTPNDAFDLRLGRVGADVFMLSDYRSVGYAQTWVRPPNEFYGWIPLHSLYGGDVTYHFSTGATRWHLKGLFGSTGTTIPTSQTVAYDFAANKMRSISLRAERGPWQFMGALSRMNVTSEATPSILTNGLNTIIGNGLVPANIRNEAERLNNGMWTKGAEIDYQMLGAAYQQGNWQFQSEIARIRGSSSLLPGGYTGYAMMGYRIGKFTPYAVVSTFRPDRKGRRALNDWSALGSDAVELQTESVASYNTFRIDQSSLALGVRWDFSSRAALKLQVDRKWIGERGYGLWQINNSLDNGKDREVNIFSAVVDFTF